MKLELKLSNCKLMIYEFIFVLEMVFLIQFVFRKPKIMK